MEVFLDGYHVFEAEATSENDTSQYIMNNVDAIVCLCEIAKQSFCFLTPSSFHKLSLKHHPNMSKGEKELCMNILFQVWKSSTDENIFYQALLSRICLSCEVATRMIELLQDITVLE